MGKKSNKTEHVLKLIAKNDEIEQDDDFFGLDEGEFDMMIAAKTERKSEKIQTAAEQRQEEEPTAAAPRKSSVVAFREVTPAGRKQEASAVKAVREEKAPYVKAVREEEAPDRAVRKEAGAGSAVLEKNDDLVNIAEVLTREKLSLVMERMKVCGCKTCVNDVLALALNSLPTKYVTTDAGRQYFQLDVYKKQYETDILAALTKACVRVKAAPRHDL